MPTRKQHQPVTDRDEELALNVRLARFALVLSGDEELARQLVDETVAEQGQRGAGFTAEAWQYRQFRRLYELWRARPKVAGERARLFLPGGEDEAIRKGLNPVLAVMLGSMPSQHRALLLLIYGENYSYAATAHLLDMEIEPLMRALAVARAKLVSADHAAAAEPEAAPSAARMTAKGAA